MKHLVFLSILCKESPGFISIPSAYHWSQLHNRWAKLIPWFASFNFCVNLDSWDNNYSCFIREFNFLLFISFGPRIHFHGSVYVPDDPSLKLLFSLCHRSTLTLILNVRWALLLWTCKCSSKKPLLRVEWQPNFWLTSPLLQVPAMNANSCEIFCSKAIEGGKELALSLRIIIL